MRTSAVGNLIVDRPSLIKHLQGKGNWRARKTSIDAKDVSGRISDATIRNSSPWVDQENDDSSAIQRCRTSSTIHTTHRSYSFLPVILIFDGAIAEPYFAIG